MRTLRPNDSKNTVPEQKLSGAEPLKPGSQPIQQSKEAIMKLKMKKGSKKELQDEMSFISHDKAKNLILGERGTPQRDRFEADFQEVLLGDLIKMARKKRGLTQAQLGELIDSDKAHISKIENNVRSARIETLVRIAEALQGKLSLRLDLDY